MCCVTILLLVPVTGRRELVLPEARRKQHSNDNAIVPIMRLSGGPYYCIVALRGRARTGTRAQASPPLMSPPLPLLPLLHFASVVLLVSAEAVSRSGGDVATPCTKIYASARLSKISL